MTLRATPVRVAWLAWAATGAVLLLLLLTPSVSLPGDSPGVRRFRTPPLAPGYQLSQTFTMPSAGLTAVELSPVAVGNVSGSVRITILDITRDLANVVLHTADVPASELVRDSRYRFAFPPIAGSKEQRYRIDLTSADDRPATGVALLATKGERYEGGTLLVNGDMRWADLAFQAEAPAPRIGRMLLDWNPEDPWRRPVAIAALAASWLALGLALQALARTVSPGSA